MSPRPTIRDVAVAAGVSVASVSKAVNGRYGVSPEMTERVMAAVRDLGYESSLVASSMRSRRTGVIGVLVADFEPFSAEILKGVGRAVSGTAYDLLAYSGSHQDGTGWERRSISRLSGTLIDGAIMVTPTTLAVEAGIPVVAVDPHAGRADLPTVESDSFAGAQQAVRHLIDLGHRRIGFVAGRPDLRSATARERGYRAALVSAGISVDPALIAAGQYEVAAARRAAEHLLDLPHPPTAVFAANDLSALAVVAAAQGRGVRVPDDLSIIGFDDIPEATRATPQLTTVRQPIQQLGETATRMLLALMNDEQLDQTQVLLPTRLIARDTTAAPERARSAT
ncbi:LacI family DNA-binding transcriptional regulator [Schumannella sp. 10F1B-5-1]|uniref:LacI family DNA-binding transcriptional regulator n=1 Tax=Schumannella sp. 10F1B-5-1 TaxID=2590780 RepID=UPI00112FE9E2|nr:LacI family DNA-binding transcriptional regulator [Schumannella sp. 10F1B-5-1]TPW72885.1 substrate-binding domain-containing protein [Schumannella sp. 10F1B-5-1]